MSARPGTVLAGRTPFPYVNGGLFSGNLDAPRFTRIARSYLIHIGGLDWKKIDPDIFGSMIQAVAEGEERGALGMHYTSVPNILKVLNPLFLDDLRARLEEASDNARMLLNLSGMLVSACRRSRDTNEHTNNFAGYQHTPQNGLGRQKVEKPFIILAFWTLSDDSGSVYGAG